MKKEREREKEGRKLRGNDRSRRTKNLLILLFPLTFATPIKKSMEVYEQLKVTCQSGDRIAVDQAIQACTRSINLSLYGIPNKPSNTYRIYDCTYEYGIWIDGLRGACLSGRSEIVDLIAAHGAAVWEANNIQQKIWNMCLEYACEGGHRDLIELMIERGANNWNDGIEHACLGGHLDIVKLMMEYGAQLDGKCICYALEGGNREIVNLILERTYSGSITSRASLVESVCRGGNMDLLLMLFKEFFGDVNTIEDKSYALKHGLMGACEGGHIRVIDQLIEWGANDWSSGLYRALLGGHSDVVDLMILKGATYQDQESIFNQRDSRAFRLLIEKNLIDYVYHGHALVYACRTGKKEIVRELLARFQYKQNPEYLEWSLQGACSGGHRDLVELIIENGAIGISQGLECAFEKAQHHLFSFLIAKGCIPGAQPPTKLEILQNYYPFNMQSTCHGTYKLSSFLYKTNKMNRKFSRKFVAHLIENSSQYVERNQARDSRYQPYPRPTPYIVNSVCNRRLLRPPTNKQRGRTLYGIVHKFCCRDIGVFSIAFSPVKVTIKLCLCAE